MNSTLKIDFNLEKIEQSEILIASLSELPFYAFEENENVLSAYIKSDDYSPNLLDELINTNNIAFSISSIEDKNWNEEWERDFEPVLIHDFAMVRAHFHNADKNVLHDIIITPKMSFGTGHHSTTYLMIQEMENIVFENKSVLDFGTGTGVLAILAEKMRGRVLAIDHDDWSITNAMENISQNNCVNIKVQKGDVPVSTELNDIILANINTHVLIENADKIRAICANEGYILLSGFLGKDVKMIEDRFVMAGFVLDKVVNKDDWHCIKMKLVAS